MGWYKFQNGYLKLVWLDFLVYRRTLSKTLVSSGKYFFHPFLICQDVRHAARLPIYHSRQLCHLLNSLFFILFYDDSCLTIFQRIGLSLHAWSRTRVNSSVRTQLPSLDFSPGWSSILCTFPFCARYDLLRILVVSGCFFSPGIPQILYGSSWKSIHSAAFCHRLILPLSKRFHTEF